MAKKKKQRTAATSPVRPALAPTPPNPLTSLPADPPRRHRWFLIATAVGVVSWMLFLLAMGLRG